MKIDSVFVPLFVVWAVLAVMRLHGRQVLVILAVAAVGLHHP